MTKVSPRSAYRDRAAQTGTGQSLDFWLCPLETNNHYNGFLCIIYKLYVLVTVYCTQMEIVC